MDALISLLAPRKFANTARRRRFQEAASCITLPTEIIDYILAHMLLENAAFSTIESFSLANHQLRAIAFRQFFSLLTVNTKNHWANLCRIRGMTSWARTLDCTSTALYVHTSNLLAFRNLRAVSIDFYDEGLHIIYDSTNRIFPCMPPQITTLELLHLPSVTTQLLSLIATYCPRLNSLVLRCSDRLLSDCCWNCYEECGSLTIHSPSPDHYCNAEDLANAFGKALRPLHKLAHIELGVFLSDNDLFYDHLDHAGDFRFPPTADMKSPYGPDQCATCAVLADRVRKTELIGAATLASHLPSVASVTWSTWFAQKEPGDNRQQRTTTIWTRHEDGGGVAARRAPW